MSGNVVVDGGGGAAATVQQLSTAELASLENVVAAQQGVVGGEGNHLVTAAISGSGSSIAGATFSYQPDGTLTMAGGGGQVFCVCYAPPCEMSISSAIR